MNKKRPVTKDSCKRKLVKNMNKSRAKSSFKETKQTKSSSSDSNRDPTQIAKQDAEPAIAGICCEHTSLPKAENKVLRLPVIQPFLETVQDNSSPEMQDTKTQPQVQKRLNNCLPQVQNSFMQLHSQGSTIDSAFRITEEIMEPLLGKAGNSSLPAQELSMRPRLKESFIQSSVSNTENKSLRKLPISILKTKSQREDQDRRRRIEDESLMQPQKSLQSVPPKKQIKELLKTEEKRSLNIRDILMPSKCHKENEGKESSNAKDSLTMRNLKNDTTSMQVSNIEVEKNIKNIDLQKIQNVQKYYDSRSPALNQLILDVVVKKPKNQDLLKIQETSMQSKIEVKTSQLRIFEGLLEHQKQILNKRSKIIRKSNTHPELQSSENQVQQKFQTSVNKESKIISKIRKMQPKPILENKPVRPMEFQFPISQSNQKQGLQKSKTLMQPKLQQTKNIPKESSRLISTTLIQTEKLPGNASSNQKLIIQSSVQKEDNNSVPRPNYLQESMKLLQIISENYPLIIQEPITQQTTGNQDEAEIQHTITQSKQQSVEVNINEPRSINKLLMKPQKSADKYIVTEVKETFKQSKHRTKVNSVPRILKELQMQPQNRSVNEQIVTEIQLKHQIEVNDSEPRTVRELLKQLRQSSGNELTRKPTTKIKTTERVPSGMRVHFIKPPLKKKSENKGLVNIQETIREQIIETTGYISEPSIVEISSNETQSSSENYPSTNLESIPNIPLQMPINQSAMKTQELTRANLHLPEYNSEQRITVGPLTQSTNLEEGSLSMLEANIYTTLQRTENLVLPSIEDILINLKRQKENDNERRIVRESVVHTESFLESEIHQLLQTTEPQDLPQEQEMSKPQMAESESGLGIRKIFVIDQKFVDSVIENWYSESNQANMYNYLIHQPVKQTENKSIANIQTTEECGVRNDRQSLIHPNYSESNPPNMRNYCINPSLQETENQSLLSIQTADRIMSGESLIEPHYSEGNPSNMHNYYINPSLQETENQNLQNIQTAERRILVELHNFEDNPSNMHNSVIHPALQDTENQNLQSIQTDLRITGESLIEPHYSESISPNTYDYSTHSSLQKTENRNLQKIPEGHAEIIQSGTASVKVDAPMLTYISGMISRSKSEVEESLLFIDCMEQIEKWFAKLDKFNQYNTARFQALLEKMADFKRLKSLVKDKQVMLTLGKDLSFQGVGSNFKRSTYALFYGKCESILRSLKLYELYLNTTYERQSELRIQYLNCSLQIANYPVEVNLFENRKETMNIINQLSKLMNILSFELEEIHKFTDNYSFERISEVNNFVRDCEQTFAQ